MSVLTRMRSPMVTLTRSVVGYWEMNAASGNEPDSSGNGYTMVDNNTVASGAGVVGNCRVFTSPDFFALASGSATAFDPTGSFTVRARANFTDISARRGIFSKSNSTGNMREWTLAYSSSSSKIEFVCSSNGSSFPTAVASLATIVTGTWYDIFAGWDAALKRFWITTDLEPIIYTTSDFAGPVFAGTADLVIGAENSGAASRMAGSIDTVGFWMRRLSLAEMKKWHGARSYPS